MLPPLGSIHKYPVQNIDGAALGSISAVNGENFDTSGDDNDTVFIVVSEFRPKHLSLKQTRPKTHAFTRNIAAKCVGNNNTLLQPSRQMSSILRDNMCIRIESTVQPTRKACRYCFSTNVPTHYSYCGCLVIIQSINSPTGQNIRSTRTNSMHRIATRCRSFSTFKYNPLK